MSDGNVFSRWSRRKLDARQNGPKEKAATPSPEAGLLAEPVEAEAAEAQLADAGLVEAQPADAEPADAEPAEAETPETLPRLEDLHADSDLSAFLRKGVPAALRNSALRKMWSLDPVIRDYVGPAEYAWNFNEPGSMAGFGPLEPNSAVVNFLSTAGRSVLAELEGTPTATDVPADGQPTEMHSVSDGEENAETVRTAEAPASEAPAAAEPTLVESASPKAAADAGATSCEVPGPAESAPEPARPRHGGAVPR
ncbi:MAG: hypothetical protein K0S21_1064 [Rhizobiaceae bacterium]|jgi:hypothetical protein|nr:hypothetical protein [Rhizobiaceae bacterium]